MLLSPNVVVVGAGFYAFMTLYCSLEALSAAVQPQACSQQAQVGSWAWNLGSGGMHVPLHSLVSWARAGPGACHRRHAMRGAACSRRLPVLRDCP